MEEILASIRRIIADDQSLPSHLPFRDATPAPPPHETPRDTPFAPAAAPEPTLVPDTPPPAPVPSSAPAYAGAVAPPPVHPTPSSVRSVPNEMGVAHGPISAPQFAMPHGPVGDEPLHDAPEPEPQVEAFAATASIESEAMPAPNFADPEPALTIEPGQEEPVFEPAVDVEAPEALHPAPAAAYEPSPLFSTATNSAVSEAFNMLAASRLADNSDELMNLAREMIRPLLRTWIDDNLPSMVERLIRAEIERVARGGR